MSKSTKSTPRPAVPGDVVKIGRNGRRTWRVVSVIIFPNFDGKRKPTIAYVQHKRHSVPRRVKASRLVVVKAVRR